MKRAVITYLIVLYVVTLFPGYWVVSVNAVSSGTALEKIKFDRNLRLDKRFDTSTYFGVIDSREELQEIWSHMIQADDNTFFFPGVGVPPPPKVDFGKYQALWFADRGAHASFVESAKLVEDPKTGSLTAVIKVWHSDFGSSKLNLWQIPRTQKKITFRETHHYDRGP